MSASYPCLSQVVKDYQVGCSNQHFPRICSYTKAFSNDCQIPEFDNFYLDMNGIIHACSHPNDEDPTFRISDEKIFSDIFRYLEVRLKGREERVTVKRGREGRNYTCMISGKQIQILGFGEEMVRDPKPIPRP